MRGFRRIGRRGTLAPRLDLDLAAQLLDDALELPQALHQLNLALARVLWGRIGVSWARLPRCPTGGGEDAWNLSSAAIGAGHLLVATDFATAAGDA